MNFILDPSDIQYSIRCKFVGEAKSIADFIFSLKNKGLLEKLDIRPRYEEHQVIPEVLDQLIVGLDNYLTIPVKELHSLDEYKEELEKFELLDKDTIDLLNLVRVRSREEQELPLFQNRVLNTIVAIDSVKTTGTLWKFYQYMAFGSYEDEITPLIHTIDVLDNEEVSSFRIVFDAKTDFLKAMEYLAKANDFNAFVQVVEYVNTESNKDIIGLIEVLINPEEGIHSLIEWTKEDIDDLHRISPIVDF